MQHKLLPTLEGKTQGIVGMRPTKHGRNEYDLQCQNCGTIETAQILVLMKTKFPRCTSKGNNSKDRTRLCPDCHNELCDREFSDCRRMLDGR